MSLSKALTAAAGNAGGGGESLYVEDVFSTYLYEGNGSTQTITNGIDLDGEGGMVWIKNRSTAYNNVLFDTERGATNYLKSNDTDGQSSIATLLTSFNNNGFDVGSQVTVNNNGDDIASWTFRKAEKFFDVVTYTGTGSVQTIAHNLGVAPAIIITKKTSGTSNWAVNDPSQANPWSGALLLNSTNAFATASTVWNDTAPTDSVFTVGTADATNVSGQTYVAYLFASDAGGFGDDGSESIIKCGSFTASTGAEVDLGFEPQWVLLKSSTGAADWYMVDNMRGWGADRGSNDAFLSSNTSGAEFNSTNSLGLTPTGFTSFNGGNQTYIYIAIRRPMKTPESGTEVFDVQQSITTDPNFVTGFDPDMTFSVPNTTASFRYIFSRLTGTKFMETYSTNAESTGAAIKWDYSGGAHNGFTSYYGWNFKRATGFFDVVAYTGDGTTTQLVEHNLVVKPELVIQKRRDSTSDWFTSYLIDGSVNKTLLLNSTGATGQPQAIVYGLTYAIGAFNSVIGNINSANYIAYLFATLAGVSKVGSYTGTGSFMDIDCGFSAGARFILIKRTDSTGDWYVWDSVRGIVAGNDPYLLLNSTAAEVTSTDYIDPLSSGFRITTAGAEGPLGASGGTYIFLAIAQVT